MSREVQSYVSLLFSAIILQAGYINSFSDNCLELIKTDIDEIENYLSKLNLTDVPTVKMMVAGFKCPISALPFGALKSDWSRLLLLQEAQPDGSIVKRKLVRLMRLLIIAYYQMEERFDVTSSDAQTGEKSLVNETTTIVATDDTNKPHCLDSNCSWTGDTLDNSVDCQSHIQISLTTPLSTENVYSKVKSDTTRNEIVVIRNFTGSHETTSITPIYVRHQNATSSINFSAVTIPYRSGGVKNVTSKQLDNCLKQSLKDIMRRKTNQAYHKVFETIKNKARRYTERAIRNANEIDDYGRDRTRISPPNVFWRYVTLPATVAQDYRMQELSGFGTGARKSQKRAKWNNDLYESFRRFYGVDKNEEAAKKYAENRNDISIERPGKK